jgi:predicted Kef-type K+ transport protein
MCYSPEADLVAGFVVGAVGIDALRHVDDRRDLALASVPLVLAAHQLIEAVGWWGLQDRVPEAAGTIAIVVYLVIAMGVVPGLVPYAVMRTERSPTRRRLMVPFVALGVAVGAILLVALSTGPYGASIGGRYIAYETTLPWSEAMGVAYVIAVCTPLLLSSHRRLVAFGVINVVSVVCLATLLAQGFISLWCVWAAISSVVVTRHIRERSAARYTDQTAVRADG